MFVGYDTILMNTLLNSPGHGEHFFSSFYHVSLLSINHDIKFIAAKLELLLQLFKTFNGPFLLHNVGRSGYVNTSYLEIIGF